MPAAVFDTLAPDYDAHFTDSTLGRILRRTVWRWLDRAFAPGDRVLELNCGTGEDAVHLAARGVRVLATDASPAMLAVAQAKADRAGLHETVEVRRLEIEHLDQALGHPPAPLDGAFSNFGGLNCVTDLHRAAAALAALLKPGARVVLCVMGPLVPWEWAWFAAHGQPAKALRRLAPSGANWRGVKVRYPSPRALRRAFAPHFAPHRTGPLGVLLPPTYAEPWARRHPGLVAWLDRCERHVETWSPLAWLGDHYLVELERR
ncbi:MAG TPA: class I SAM-dependent methyltransferase [Gemmatimonadales bacterium]|nr:class I SAM-dependent methyltransferase [Gemmatimonadales bacterium]